MAVWARIGSTAARVLTEDSHDGTEPVLTGPDLLDARGVAAALAEGGFIGTHTEGVVVNVVFEVVVPFAVLILAVFILAVFVGFIVIQRVPPLLHTRQIEKL